MRPRQLHLLPPARPLGERLGAEFFRVIPERPGVYLLCGVGSGVLYVGKALNLRRRLATYRSARPEGVSRKLSRLLALVERVYWDECSDERAALARERELLRTLQPRFNTVGVRPAVPQQIGWGAVPGGVILGIGEGAELFQHLTAAVPMARPAFAALLRLTWSFANPSRPLASMPPPLIRGRPPEVWRFELAGAASVLWPDYEARLRRLLATRQPPHQDWPGLRANRFEATWQSADLETLLKFAAHVASQGLMHRGVDQEQDNQPPP